MIDKVIISGYFKDDLQFVVNSLFLMHKFQIGETHDQIEMHT
jgi:hypothetical protein